MLIVHVPIKRWLNNDCRVARNTYHHARKLYNKFKTPVFKNILKTVSKEYNSKISKKCQTLKNQRVDKLPHLKTTNPKMINSVDKRSSQLSPLDDLFKFSKI